MDYFLAGYDQSQTNQPNSQTGSLPWLVTIDTVDPYCFFSVKWPMLDLF